MHVPWQIRHTQKGKKNANVPLLKGRSFAFCLPFSKTFMGLSIGLCICNIAYLPELISVIAHLNQGAMSLLQETFCPSYLKGLSVILLDGLCLGYIHYAGFSNLREVQLQLIVWILEPCDVD